MTRLFREMTVLNAVVAPPATTWRQLGTIAVEGHEAERAEALLEFVGMRRFAGHRAAAPSFGQQKLVELAQILMLSTLKLVMLDEPAGGINPTLISHMGR